ncbi:TetR family transcriptional regulator [Streptomyces sp. NPDC056785]|uniref:TetR family transcriptional regulator n=1 Tax=Streptomyces sp. NPDC056785 TaxID=3345944 RepID=UPI0036A8C8E8
MNRGQLTAAGQAARQRLIETAAVEFATYGIAGARIDRISDSSSVSKAQIYKYYRSKDELFDAVFSAHLDMIVETVPLTGEDLPGYAVRLYDSYLARPELTRLATWARLERTPTGDLFHSMPGHDDAKLQAIADAQAKGLIEPSFSPSDVLNIVTSMSMTWSPASAMYAASNDDPKADHDRRRQALALTIQRAFAPVD